MAAERRYGEGEILGCFIDRWMRDYLLEPSHNHLGPGFAAKAWAGHLIGFSSGDDPFYQELKQHIGPFHWTPLEAFTLGKGTPDVRPEELTVVSWALAQSEEAKAGNRRETLHPSEAWTRARAYGQDCNRALHVALLDVLRDGGYAAVAPALLSSWSEHETSARFGLASTWSERHIAYASGLGTFGLSGGLITARGMAVRLGSIVVRAVIPPTPHAYDGPFDYCLFFAQGGCRRCVIRCPVGSVSERVRDKEACSRHLGPLNRHYIRTHFGFDGYACGLCQTGVPCESRIPALGDDED